MRTPTGASILITGPAWVFMEDPAARFSVEVLDLTRVSTTSLQVKQAELDKRKPTACSKSDYVQRWRQNGCQNWRN